MLLTYQRGGSTLLGEMFNRHPNALYIFEPLQSIYNDIYAIKHEGFETLDILFNTDGSHRLFVINYLLQIVSERQVYPFDLINPC